MAGDVLYCGYEIRRTRGNDLTVLHFQDMSWEWFTLLNNEKGSLTDVGTFFKDGTVPREKAKTYHPTRKQVMGMGPVRGYVMTFNPRFGVQLWLFVNKMVGKWSHNVPVLVAEAKVDFRSKKDIQECWLGHLTVLERDFPVGLNVFVAYDARTRRTRLKDEDGDLYDIAAFFRDEAPVAEVDPEGGGELPQSPAG